MILAMKKIRQREKELKITQDEWFKTWMLSRVKKRKEIDSHKLQSLRDIFKKGGETVIKDFEDRFQEVIIEGKRQKTSVVNYTELLYKSKGELETLYMGTPSEAQKQFHRSPF